MKINAEKKLVMYNNEAITLDLKSRTILIPKYIQDVYGIGVEQGIDIVFDEEGSFDNMQLVLSRNTKKYTPAIAKNHRTLPEVNSKIKLFGKKVNTIIDFFKNLTNSDLIEIKINKVGEVKDKYKVYHFTNTNEVKTKYNVSYPLQVDMTFSKV